VYKTALKYAETVALIIAVSVPVHYLGEVDWPLTIGVGAAASIALRWLIHLTDSNRRPPPYHGGA
jgi:hypothetical protein